MENILYRESFMELCRDHHHFFLYQDETINDVQSHSLHGIHCSGTTLIFNIYPFKIVQGFKKAYYYVNFNL